MSLNGDGAEDGNDEEEDDVDAGDCGPGEAGVDGDTMIVGGEEAQM